MSSDKLKMYARARPALDVETEDPEYASCLVVSVYLKGTLRMLNAPLQVEEAKKRVTASSDITTWNFDFDFVFGFESTQEAVYNTTTRQIVKDVIKGGIGCVLCYGQVFLHHCAIMTLTTSFNTMLRPAQAKVTQ